MFFARESRSFAFLFLFPLSLLFASTTFATGCVSQGGEVADAGKEGADSGGDGGGGTRFCSCCGTKVELAPEEESCGTGACDPYCGFIPRDAACSPPPAYNDRRCPATYEGLDASGEPCAPIGLRCKYGFDSVCEGKHATMACGNDAGSSVWVVTEE
jgi:hypothetical protein